MGSVSLKRFTSSQTRQCQLCGRVCNIKGINSHQKSCMRKFQSLERDLAYEKSLEKSLEDNSIVGGDMSIDHAATDDINSVDANDDSHSVPRVSHLSDSGLMPEVSYGQDDTPLPVDPAAETDSSQELRVDDIRTEYHPHSGRLPTTFHFENYKPRSTVAASIVEEKPWSPFRSRADFEFADISFKGALSAQQTESLIKLIRKVASGEAVFTLSSLKDLNDTWTMASKLLTPFEERNFTVPYKGENREFTMHYRPLWEWTLDLMNNEQLKHHFVWDAQRLFKYNGESFVRFYHEPWTGERFWQIQSSLPPDGSPLAYIIYCDKANLSSFGTQKGYPVVARIVNLPVDIRNGNGLGGGRVVGWLPTEFNDTEDEGGTGYAQHKRVVWHDAMAILLESIKKLSEVGFWFKCADGKERRIFPCIMILSADYEEQCIMALIRGPKGFASCPVCLVPSNECSDLSKIHIARDTESHKADIDLANFDTVADREDHLKDLGLRPVPNVFWTIKNSDPYKALCWDRLHAYHGGLFGHHIWKDVREEANALGRWAVAQINNQFDLIPRWRGLYHSDRVLSVSFCDGSKLEDISKQLLYAAHNVLEASESGYLLLCCLRSYLVLDTYLSFEVHTSETLAAGEEELLNFSNLLEDYIESLDDTDNWNFPKAHSHRHAFDDIRAKGVTRNYNTKTNEKLHGPIKDSYHLRTNFKNVASQILKADHICFVSVLIRSCLEDFDSNSENSEDGDDCINDPKPSTTVSFPPSQHHILGAVQKVISFATLESEHHDDPAFTNLGKKVSEFLSDFLPVFGIDVPAGTQYPIKLTSSDTITPYNYLKLNYESKITWRQETDYLRCSPKFHGRPRYDHVIVQTDDGQIFARLIYVFSITIGRIKYPLALIQPFDALIQETPKDRDLGLFRVRAQPRADSEIFPVGTFIRGALLVKDEDQEDEFLIVDIIDADMFLRVKDILK